MSLIKGFVVRGLIAGLIAGICAGALGLAVGENQINQAITVESNLSQAPQAHVLPSRNNTRPPESGREAEHLGGVIPEHLGGVIHDTPQVSRQTQHLGLVLATGLYGLALGGLLALVFAVLRGRTAHRSDRRLALGLTTALFVAVAVVPLIKYPANPPGIGDPETIGYRTELYLVMVAGSLAALLGAWRVARLVPAQRRAWRNAAAVASFCALVAILAVALPGVDEVPSAYPTGLIHNFRLASAGLQLTMWSVLGVSFAILVGRRPTRSGPARPLHSP